jgi:tripartite-type tricarboxylate transporter receptor subunit TctC
MKNSFGFNDLANRFACKFIRGLVGAIMAVAFSTADAQTWPIKPLRIVVPQPPGGGPDLVIRNIARAMSQKLGQPVVVDYKPGAGGNIAAIEVVRSGADGYTWLLATETLFTINPLLYSNLGFNKNDLLPLSLIGSFTQVLACHPSVGVNTVADLVSKAKAKNLTYASSGNGSPGHLTMAMLLNDAKVDMTHIPYRGPQPAVQDLLGGQVDCAFLVVAAVNEHLKSGRLVAIATSGRQRSETLPNIFTAQEQGFKTVDATFWLGVFGPKGTPSGVQTQFLKALEDALKMQEVKDAFAVNGTKLEGTTPEVAKQELDQIAQRWANVAKKINLKVD